MSCKHAIPSTTYYVIWQTNVVLKLRWIPCHLQAVCDVVTSEDSSTRAWIPYFHAGGFVEHEPASICFITQFKLFGRSYSLRSKCPPKNQLPTTKRSALLSALAVWTASFTLSRHGPRIVKRPIQLYLKTDSPSQPSKDSGKFWTYECILHSSKNEQIGLAQDASASAVWGSLLFTISAFPL